MEQEKWSKSKYNDFLEKLKALQEKEYRLFSEKIISTKYQILGIRTPMITKLVNEIKKTDYYQFLQYSGSTYYEEVLIEGFVIANIKNTQLQMEYLDRFINKIDNWAICDMTISRMKQVQKNKEDYLPWIKKCLKSKKEFSRRFGFVLLLDYYVEDQYLELLFDLCNTYCSLDYYVQMAVAWLLSYCYLLDKEKTLAYLEKSKLDIFTYNKAISKIRESKRISKEEKEFLKSYYQKL